MGQKHEYATKTDLEGLVLRMREAGIPYDEALEEFKTAHRTAVNESLLCQRTGDC